MAKAAARSRATASASAAEPRARINTPREPIPEWPWIYFLAAGFAIALVVFGPALGGTFIFDDFHLPFADPNASQMPAAFWIGGARPVLTATYWLNFLISGASPFAYHLVNVLLHAGTSVLIFFIYDRLFAISHAPSHRRWFALFGATLFLVHPLQTESVDYIAGRSELVSGFFFCAAWLVFLRNFEKDAGFGLTGKILLLGALAVLSKESAIGLPALLLLTDLYFSDRPILQQLTRRLKLYSVFVLGAVAAAVLILRSLTSGTAAGFSSGVGPFDYALTQCRVILTYLRLFLIPAGQNADWQLPFYHSFTQGAAGWYVLGLLALLALTLWLYNRERLISFGLAAFLLMLAPTSSIVPIKDALAERRMYLPIAGLILAFLGVAAKVLHTPVQRWVTAAMLVLACAALSHSRSAVWASDLTLWRDSAQANPANYRAHFGLGSALLIRRDCAGAAREFAAARSLEKSDDQILWNLAVAYQCGKQPAEALVAFRSYAAAHPTADAYNQIGLVEAALSNTEAALDAFDQSLKIDPNNSMAYAYRGVARVALNDPEAAQADLRRALDLDPQNQVAAKGFSMLAARP